MLDQPATPRLAPFSQVIQALYERLQSDVIIDGVSDKQFQGLSKDCPAQVLFLTFPMATEEEKQSFKIDVAALKQYFGITDDSLSFGLGSGVTPTDKQGRAMGTPVAKGLPVVTVHLPQSACTLANLIKFERKVSTRPDVEVFGGRSA